MVEFVHHHERLNGLKYHFVTAGTGRPVLFLHGFPDLWHSWKPVMARFAEAGFQAIAPDLRGFGESEGAPGVDQATAFDVLGDLIAMLDHLGLQKVGLVGHDWGGALGWPIVQLRPDRFTAMAGLSVPYQPRGQGSMVDMLRAVAPPDLYFLYFLQEGVAEKELDADPERFLRRIFYTSSGERTQSGVAPMRLASNGLLVDALDEPDGPMTFFPDELVSIYAESFRKTGFRSALNTYRSLHRTWELLAGWADVPPTVPSRFIVGERDITLTMLGGREAVEAMSKLLPNAEDPVILDGLGHFIQMEAPDRVADILIDFFDRHLPE